jgi:hypothetical protein
VKIKGIYGLGFMARFYEMKRRSRVILVLAVLPALGGIFWIAKPEPKPVFVFKRYTGRAYRDYQLAKFELRNTTGSSIWVMISSDTGYLRIGCLERWGFDTTNGVGSHVHRPNDDSYLTGRKVAAGESLIFDVILLPEKPVEQVGLWYSLGNFKDGKDFVENCTPTIPGIDATPKERVLCLWENVRKSIRGSKGREIWCPEVVSFQTDKSKLSGE